MKMKDFVFLFFLLFSLDVLFFVNFDTIFAFLPFPLNIVFLLITSPLLPVCCLALLIDMLIYNTKDKNES